MSPNPAWTFSMILRVWARARPERDQTLSFCPMPEITRNCPKSEVWVTFHFREPRSRNLVRTVSDIRVIRKYRTTRKQHQMWCHFVSLFQLLLIASDAIHFIFNTFTLQHGFWLWHHKPLLVHCTTLYFFGIITKFDMIFAVC